MNKHLLTLYTRTPLHVGSGTSVEVVDLPIIREFRDPNKRGIIADACRVVRARLIEGEPDFSLETPPSVPRTVSRSSLRSP